jgi:SSS family solute:Na+ symporter
MDERKQILSGRLFVAAILVITFILSLITNRSIFKLGVWSFTGFASLLPVIVAALYWKRSSAAGVAASIITTVLLWFYFLIKGWNTPGYTVFESGILPVVVILTGSAIMLIVVSLLSKAPNQDCLQRYFGPRNQEAREDARPAAR